MDAKHRDRIVKTLDELDIAGPTVAALQLGEVLQLLHDVRIRLLEELLVAGEVEAVAAHLFKAGGSPVEVVTFTGKDAVTDARAAAKAAAVEEPSFCGDCPDRETCPDADRDVKETSTQTVPKDATLH